MRILVVKTLSEITIQHQKPKEICSKTLSSDKVFFEHMDQALFPRILYETAKIKRFEALLHSPLVNKKL
jgi:hypothetical protein